jgi:hypothetical protein
MEGFVAARIDKANIEHGSNRSQKFRYEGTHPQRHGDNPGSIGAVLHRKNNQNAGLLPPFLDEAYRRSRPHRRGVHRFLDRHLTARLGSKIEPDHMLVAVQRFDIGHRIIKRSFSGAASSPGGTDFANLEAR